ncbi:MAG: cysteine desulfurase family protein [Patescibacteria group bacterium]
MAKPIYLDNAAATPTDPAVVSAMQPLTAGLFGNPSSAHSFGRAASNAVEQSRRSIANFLNCQDGETVFTGSGTESNNLALIGVAKANKHKGRHIVTSVIEHPSIINACRALEKDGYDITYLPVGKDGTVSSKELENSLKEETILVSIHLANSEIGVIQPIAELAKITKKHGAYFHTDACQAAAYLDLDVDKLGVDLLTINGSKCYGPKGIAVLYVREGTDIFPIHFGGGQQQGLRSGTENVPGIVGLAKAVEIITNKRENESKRLGQLRDDLQNQLEKRGAKINVKNSPRLPNHLSVVMPIDETDVVKYFDQRGIAVSSGSACSSKSLVESHVLQAVGLTSEQIQKTVRLTLGYQSSQKDIKQLLETL